MTTSSKSESKPQFNFRFDTKSQRDSVMVWFSDLVRSVGEVTGRTEALQYLMDQYDLNFKNLRYQNIPDTVEQLIAQVNCEFISYEEYREGKETKTGFVCYEKFHGKKKPDPIGTEHDLLLMRCSKCKAGKLARIALDVQKQLRKKNIKGLLDLRDILINLQYEGGLAQIYICKALLLEEKKLILCTNGVHLTCPLEDGSPEVQVKKHCYTVITPWTQEPPCQYLIDPHIMVQVAPSEEAEKIIEAIAIEYKDAEEGQEPPHPIKEVAAEVVEPEEKPKVKPKKKTKKKEQKKK